MKQNNNNTKISTWTLWAPLKFSFLCFGLIFLSASINTFVLERLFAPNISHSIFITLTTIVFIFSLIFLIKKLPIKKMDQRSFISLHIAQTLITTICFYTLTYFLIYNTQTFMIKMTLMATHSIGLFFITMLLFGLITLYISGVYFSNIYAKFRRIQDLNIPTWKIIFIIPFGFSALWIPGFLMKPDNKQQTITSNNKTYNKFIDWVLTNTTNIVSVFIFITLLSTLLFGITPVLLTFIFALIYGIWTLQIGEKKFKQKISGQYSTVAMIINIVMILTIIVFSTFASHTSDSVTINISDTDEITQTTQG